MVEAPAVITTVIPTFRRPDLLKRAIQSCLSQTYPHFHVLVVDNCSGDTTENVVASFQDDRISYISHKERIEAVLNFQFGISQVTTPFFSLLADDDYLLSSFYETALEKLEKYPEAKFFVGSTLDVDTQGRWIDIPASKWPDKDYFPPIEGVFLQIEKYINWTGTLFRTEISKENFLDSEIKPIDLDWMFRMSAKYPFVFSKKPCACFVHHPLGYSSFSGYKLIWPSYQKIASNLQNILPESYWLPAEVSLKARFSRSLFGISCRALRLGKFDEIEEALKISKEYCEHWKFKLLFSISRFCKKNGIFLKGFGISLRFYQIVKAQIKKFQYTVRNSRIRFQPHLKNDS